MTIGAIIIAAGVLAFISAFAWAVFGGLYKEPGYDPPTGQAILGVGGMALMVAGLVVLITGAIVGF